MHGLMMTSSVNSRLKLQLFNFHPTVNTCLDANSRLWVVDRSPPLMHMLPTSAHIVAKVGPGSRCTLPIPSVRLDPCPLLQLMEFCFELRFSVTLLIVLSLLKLCV